MSVARRDVIVTSSPGSALAVCWLVVLQSSVVCLAAHSLSVLDSRLSYLYQNSLYQPRYDAYEPGFAADPAGYRHRNALQPHLYAEKITKDALKTGPGKYLVDGGYHTRTIPLYQSHQNPHDTGGYATRNAIQPHHYPGKDASPNKHSADDGYHTRTIGSDWFPMYQDYQHSYTAEPGGYATQNARPILPYRSGYDNTQDAAASSGKHLTADSGYQTRTAQSSWLSPYQHHQHSRDPHGYATQTAFHPYRSGVEMQVSGSSKDVGSSRGNHVDYQPASRPTAGNKHSTTQVDQTVYKHYDEDTQPYTKLFSDDDNDVNEYVSIGDGLTEDWSTTRGRPGVSAAVSDHYNINRVIHKPAVIST